MPFLISVTFDQVMVSLVICVAIRELMILFLPDHIAGPDGWLVRTGEMRKSGETGKEG